jgi:hypothetical protein
MAKIRRESPQDRLKVERRPDAELDQFIVFARRRIAERARDIGGSADYRAAANAIPALGHDASMCETPHVRHSKIYRSGKPPNRFVLRTSFIRLAQLGQSGGVGVELLVCSSPISGTPY